MVKKVENANVICGQSSLLTEISPLCRFAEITEGAVSECINFRE